MMNLRPALPTRTTHGEFNKQTNQKAENGTAHLAPKVSCGPSLPPHQSPILRTGPIAIVRQIGVRALAADRRLLRSTCPKILRDCCKYSSSMIIACSSAEGSPDHVVSLRSIR
jgi:hypothetical protein